ncbi:MAG: Gfo/Idh/MocA family oxidoreductase [Clostridia bacterium]|nr:Gfo/Idh/MocA family oxidoreductase [Clostridia bacterium]
MKKMRIGIICPSEIAFRRFLPALISSESFEYAGVAIASSEDWDGDYTSETRKTELNKAQRFVDNYGGNIYNGYNALIKDDSVDAIYLPLPPALHYLWGKRVLKAKKHLFVEKPSTTCAEYTKELICLARERNIAVHENYMFVYHNQLKTIHDYVNEGKIGDVRLVRIAFGFPKRTSGDFRYNKKLGGGALLDAGGYTVKLASLILGDNVNIVSSRLNYVDEFDVDIYGNAVMENADGLTAQLSFGMDNCYKCELEIWGSKGVLFTDRILTAPVGFEPVLKYKFENEPVKNIKLEPDDTFRKSIEFFHKCISDTDTRIKHYDEIIKQAEYIDQIKGDCL